MHPVPAYTDSQSTMFCANSAASAKLSVWVNRRSAVLREAVDMKIIRMEKISDPDNCANYFTKPVTATAMSRYFSYMLATERPQQSCSQGEKKGIAHDESLDVKVRTSKLKLQPEPPTRASAVVSKTGTACELAGVRAGDKVHIGGQVNDKRIYKFLSAEWDNASGDCYAYVLAPGADKPVRVLASGIAKITFGTDKDSNRGFGRGKPLPTGRDGKFTTYAEAVGRRGD